MKKNVSAILCGLWLVLLTSACVAATSGGPGGGRDDLLTRAEIETVNVSNLLELVERLRPRWLNVRGVQSFGMGSEINQVVVFQGQTLLGGIDALRQLSPDMVVSIRYLDGPTASATLPGLGTRNVEAAIVVQTTAR